MNSEFKNTPIIQVQANLTPQHKHQEATPSFLSNKAQELLLSEGSTIAVLILGISFLSCTRQLVNALTQLVIAIKAK